jgi:hypothetical protein
MGQRLLTSLQIVAKSSQLLQLVGLVLHGDDFLFFTPITALDAR